MSITTNAVNTYIVPTVNREVTMPAQPAFLAVLTSAELNVTGSGTVATIGAVSGFTEVYDQNSDFSGTTFTAPVTGKYWLYAQTFISQFGGGTSGNFRIVTSNRTYRNNQGLSTPSFKIGALADMDAGDTAIVTIVVTGLGSDTVDILANLTDIPTFFCGYLAV
jgi:hypothetical protein